MGHTYWGMNKNTFTCIGDGCVHMGSRMRACLSVFLVLVYLICSTLAAGSGVLLFFSAFFSVRTPFSEQPSAQYTISTINFPIGCALILSATICLSQLVSAVYHFVALFRRKDDSFQVAAHGSVTTVSTAKMQKVQNATNDMWDSCEYFHTRSWDKQWSLREFVYDREMVRNDDFPRVFLRKDDCRSWFHKPSKTDYESCTCCQGGHTCWQRCFPFSAFSLQLNTTLISLFHFGLFVFVYRFYTFEDDCDVFTEAALASGMDVCTTGTAAYQWAEEIYNQNRDTMIPMLVCVGECGALIISTIIAYINSTDVRGCLFFTNCDRHFRHRGAFVDLLNDLVKKEYSLDRRTASQLQSELPRAEQLPKEHPKDRHTFMIVHEQQGEEARYLRSILTRLYTRLYGQAFEHAPTVPHLLTTSMLALLDEFYSHDTNRPTTEDLLESNDQFEHVDQPVVVII